MSEVSLSDFLNPNYSVNMKFPITKIRDDGELAELMRVFERRYGGVLINLNKSIVKPAKSIYIDYNLDAEIDSYKCKFCLLPVNDLLYSEEYHKGCYESFYEY